MDAQLFGGILLGLAALGLIIVAAMAIARGLSGSNAELDAQQRQSKARRKPTSGNARSSTTGSDPAPYTYPPPHFGADTTPYHSRNHTDSSGTVRETPALSDSNRGSETGSHGSDSDSGGSSGSSGDGGGGGGGD